jgi:hypothetical protein
MSNIILILHASFGLLFILTNLWIFVDTLNADAANHTRIRALSFGVAAAMWLAYLLGGYWYVVYYAAEKAVILKGPWPLAHNFVMETKEHVLFMLVLLATFLPIAASGNLLRNKSSRSVVLWATGLMVVLGIGMEGAGAIISMGAKIASLPK